MSAAEAEESTKDEKLKAALWYAVGQIVDSVGLSQDINASPHFIGGLSEMVWAQIDNVARDLEAFAKHSTRSTINCKDVLLLGRRNEGLDELLQAETRAVRERDG
ncbi:kinetochore component CENP-S-domain-containing protein [Neohortaea acidophila]|uniref:Kinetochore component CENP-S-domain-containing protein n=1 Tax=Neohortaea acidophila TaxID=245834 RepID=A0A6A6PGA6_9PEZI|nr:kinetochore component CENP-S-domain-containing protein [Neohortaea acidophila]KAF2479010.1 kinetochore component CENP-S-domain-containing protein [Neohortaea acidophila]